MRRSTSAPSPPCCASAPAGRRSASRDGAGSPPTDPLNAALSFAYAVQARAFGVALSTAGLDVFIGFLHGFRHGRPALALDLLEPARPRIAESAVLRVLNTGMLRGDGLEEDGTAVRLGEQGRRALLDGLEARLDQTAHPDGLDREIAYRDLPLDRGGPSRPRATAQRAPAGADGLAVGERRRSCRPAGTIIW